MIAEDFVEEVIEDYKEEETHFHSSVTDGYNDQDARLVIALLHHFPTEHNVQWKKSSFCPG